MATKQVRERSTGRYAHEWGVIGNGIVGESFHEVAECQHCDKVKVYGFGDGTPINFEKTYKNREAARRAGEPLFEGY